MAVAIVLCGRMGKEEERGERERKDERGRKRRREKEERGCDKGGR